MGCLTLFPQLAFCQHAEQLKGVAKKVARAVDPKTLNSEILRSDKIPGPEERGGVRCSFGLSLVAGAI